MCRLIIHMCIVARSKCIWSIWYCHLKTIMICFKIYNMRNARYNIHIFNYVNELKFCDGEGWISKRENRVMPKYCLEESTLF